jgi:hypothetical protein
MNLGLAQVVDVCEFNDPGVYTVKVNHYKAASVPWLPDVLTSSDTAVITLTDPNTPPGDFDFVRSPAGLAPRVACYGTTPRVDFGWTSSSGANDYKIFRNGPLLADVGMAQTAYDVAVTGGTTYTYRIGAYNDYLGGSSKLSTTDAVITVPYCTGTVNVNATLNSSPWSGDLGETYGLTNFVGGGNFSSSIVPSTNNNKPIGGWVLSNGGGPGYPNGWVLDSITPSDSQTLPQSTASQQAITFTMNFSGPATPPPDFNLSQEMVWTIPSGTPDYALNHDYNSDGKMDQADIVRLAQALGNGCPIGKGCNVDPTGTPGFNGADVTFYKNSLRTVHITPGSADQNATMDLSSGSGATISLTAPGAPSGSYYSPNPVVLAPSDATTATFTVPIPLSLPMGTYTITPTGTAGGVTNTSPNLTLVVNGGPQYSLTVTKTGNGTVTSSPAGINCGSGSNCTANFPQNSTVTLTATPESSYWKFGTWGGFPVVCSGTNSVCNINMTGNKNTTATFYARPFNYIEF